MKRISLLLLLCSVGSQLLFGQSVINVQRRNMNFRKEVKTDLIVYYYLYSSNELDLAHFKSEHPELSEILPEKVSIDVPEAISKNDLVYAVTFLGNDVTDGELALMLVTDYYSDQPIFYADINLNYDFSDDGEPIYFGPRTNYKDLTFQLPDEKDKFFHIRVFHPEAQKEVGDNQESDPTPKSEPKLNFSPEKMADINKKILDEAKPKKLSLRMSVFAGFGRIKYDYIDVETGSPVEFKGSHTSKAFSLDLNYKLGPIKVGLTGTYESTQYWSLYRDRYIVFGELTSIVRETNLDEIPRDRLFGGLNLEYIIPMSKKSSINPYAKLMVAVFPDNNYYPNHHNPQNVYELNNQFAYEFGFLLDFAVAPNSSLIFSAGLNNPGFNPQSYFDEFAASNLNVSNIQGRVGLGYQHKLF